MSQAQKNVKRILIPLAILALAATTLLVVVFNGTDNQAIRTDASTQTTAIGNTFDAELPTQLFSATTLFPNNADLSDEAADETGSGVVKPPIVGVLDRAGFPKKGYEDVINGYVVTANWKDLQPNGLGSEIVANNPIDKALEEVRAHNSANPDAQMALRLRVMTGLESPTWAMDLSGGAMNYNHPLVGDAKTLIWWNDDFGQAYEELQRKLARKYDTVPELREVVISRCMARYAEPFIRSLENNKKVLVAAGYTVEKDKQCHRDQIKAHKVWTHTRQNLSFNPYQWLELPAQRVRSENEFTFEMMRYCRQQLGERCVLANNSLRHDGSTTNPLGEKYDLMYKQMGDLGGAITFQTATSARIGDWKRALDVGVDRGALSIELNSGYGSYEKSKLRAITQDLQANADKLE